MPLSIGVCPHHIFLTRDDLAALGPFGLMKPGLKRPADRDALRQAISTGLVDVIESDHAPHTSCGEARPAAGLGRAGHWRPHCQLLAQALHEGWLTAERLAALVLPIRARIFGFPAPPDSWDHAGPGRRADD